MTRMPATGDELYRTADALGAVAELIKSAADELVRLRSIMKRVGRQLDYSDEYAKDHRKKDDVLPTVLEIQNGHIRDLIKSSE